MNNIKKKIIYTIAVFLGVSMFYGTNISAQVGDTYVNHFADKNLAAEIAAKNNKNINDTITNTDIEKVDILALSSNKSITDLSGIELFTNITRISISSNIIEILPENIGNLKKLKQLYIYRGNIEYVPDSVGELEQLEDFALPRQNIKTLPSSMKNLKNLTTFEINNNLLEVLPEFNNINNPKLKNIYALDNQVKEIPELYSTLGKLETLDLSSNRISVYPASLTNLSSLKNLYLSINNMTKLPDDIGKLSQLKRFTIGINQIEELPASFTNLANLEYFDAYGNRLSALNSDFGKLTNLTELVISSNDISELPSSFKNLNKLSIFNASSNSLVLDPKVMEQLDLTSLDLSSNGLNEFPSFISSYSRLTSLSISNNNIKYFPLFVSDGTLANLNSLDMRYNQLLSEYSVGTIRSIMLTDQIAVLPSKTLLTANVKDFDINTELPPILKQYKAQNGDNFKTLDTWSITSPDGSITELTGPEDQKITSLLKSNGAYTVTFYINDYLSPIFRSSYTFPIIVSDNPTTVNKAVISGSIKDKKTKKKIKGSSISLLRDNKVVDTLYSKDGNYLFQNLKNGKYTIVVEAKSYKKSTSSFTIKNNESINKDIYLTMDKEKPSKVDNNESLPSTGYKSSAFIISLFILISLSVFRKVKRH